MSLKTDYLDGATGFNAKMADAAAAGRQWVVDNGANITQSLQANAAKGLKEFTVSLVVTFEPNNLRLQGIHWQSFRSGIIEQLSSEDIFTYECEVKLNTSDNIETRIDLEFNFTGDLD